MSDRRISFKVQELVRFGNDGGLVPGNTYMGVERPNGTLAVKIGAATWTIPAGSYTEVKELPDLVNHPPHYKYNNFEVIDILDEAFPDDPHLWAAGKYLLRAKRKANEVEDLEKAMFYIQRRLDCLK